MARRARTMSSSGYYHVVNRGTGKQLLFQEDEDRTVFLKILWQSCKRMNCKLVAYCLMDNHVHILIKADSDLDDTMHLLFTKYAVYYNGKYERNGHLFQGRFRSEPIKSPRQLLATVRYIHNNPQKAGICSRDEYKWSSWKEYKGEYRFVSPSDVFAEAGGKEEFLTFSREASDEMFLEISEDTHLNDEKAAELIRGLFSVKSTYDLQSMDKSTRDESIRLLKEKNLSIRQIERLTGIGRGTIARA